jgi:CRP/FNR family transcriptional regulator
MTDPFALYPALSNVMPSLAALGSAAGPLHMPAGAVLFAEHAPCQGFPLVLQGEVKVSRHSGDGRSLELYRVVPGELCLVSSACLFRSQPLSAQGVTTQPTTLLLIAPPVFSQLNRPGF